MNTKKTVILFIVIITILSVCLTFSACNDDEQTEYSLTFAGGEGSSGVAPATISAFPEETVVLPKNTFSKEGYGFGGWSDGTNVYAAGASYKMPSSNVVLSAVWILNEIKTVTISFDTDGGKPIAPLTVKQGEGLAASDTPAALKNGYAFIEWYLDKALTQKYDGLEKVFSENTTLYACYREIPAAKVSVFAQEEACMTSCPTDTTLLVEGDGTLNLTETNLTDYLHIEADDNQNVPSLSVLAEEADGKTVFRLVPDTDWIERVGYTLVLEEPFRFVVSSVVNLGGETDEITVSAPKLELSIAGENVTDAPVLRDGIILVSPADYLLLTETVLYLKPESALGLKITPHLGEVAASILQIEGNDGSFVCARVASMQNGSILNTNAVVVRLEACEPDEVYEDLEVYEEKDVTAEDILAAANVEQIRQNVASDPNLLAFMQLSSFAVADYVSQNKLSGVSAVSVTLPKINVSLVSNGDNSVTAKFRTSFRVNIDAKTYANVSIDAKQTIRFAISARGKIALSKWHFDVGNEVTSATELKFDVVLNLNGEAYDIKQYIGTLMGEPNADSFVARYKKAIGMDTDEITLLSVPLFEIKFKVASIFEVRLPLEFKVKLNLNAAFSSNIKYTVSKVYGIKGEKGKGVSAYKKDKWTSYNYDLYYSGYIGLKAGVSFALELSFAKMSEVGKAGVAVEVGAYFDFYGHGNRSFYSNSNYPGDKPAGAYYFETGVYVQMEVYVKSDIFFAESSAKLFEVKMPELKAGDKRLAVAFAEDTGNQIDFYGTEVSYRTFDIYRLEYMSLVSGNTTIGEANPELFLFSFDNNAFFFDRKKQTIGVKQNYLNSSYYNGGRLFATMEVRYIGANSSTTSQVLTKYFNVSYVPRELNIAPEDLDKQIDVKLNIDGVTYATIKTRIGAVPLPPIVSNEWYAANPSVVNVDWRGVVEPVTKDAVFEAAVEYLSVKVKFLFRKNTTRLHFAIWQEYTQWCHVNDDPKEVVKGLTAVPQDINEYYKMTGWSDNINSPVPMPAVEGEVAAIYEMTYELSRFTVTLDVATLENQNGEQLLGRQLLYDEILPGDTPEFDIETLPGYFVRYSLYDMEYSEMPAVYEPTVIKAELKTAEYYSVTILSIEGMALEWDFQKYSYGDDASEIMTRTNVTSYLPEGFSVNGVEYVVNSIHWFPDQSALSYITGDVNIYPICNLARPSFTYVFDPSEGSLPRTYAQYESGVKVAKNEKMSAELVEKLIPTKPSDEDFDYRFETWNVYENGVLRPINPAELVSTADVTFVASYTASLRAYKATMYAGGNAYLYDNENGLFTETFVEAHFDADDGAITDGGQERIVCFLTNEKRRELLDALDNLVDCPLPTPENEAYEFLFWSVYASDQEIEARPVFALKEVQVSVIFEMGKGEWQGVKGTFASSTEVPGDGREVVCLISNYFVPDAIVKANIWDGANNLTEINCCFVDGGYAYVAKGWSKTPDGAPITVGDAENELRLSTQSGNVTLYAVYEEVPLARIVNFYVSSATESFSDGQSGGIRTIVRGHGAPLKALAPTATKRSDDGYYVYEFVGWRAESTETIGVSEVFEKNENYNAVFDKRVKEVTLTLDAGQYGTFASTGTRYKAMTVLAGSKIYDIETPVFESESKYYNVYFDGWGYALPYQMLCSDSELRANTHRERNQVTTDTAVGITVSKGALSEDIGQNSIKGYVYDPDSKILMINGAGLTFDGGGAAFDLEMRLLTSDVTLKNITINGNVSAGIYPNSAGRPANAFVLNVEGEVNIVANVAANDSYCMPALMLDGLVAEIVGVGSGASLTIDYKVVEYEGEGERLSEACNVICANDLTIRGLALTISADVTSANGVCGLKLERLVSEYSYGFGEMLPRLSLQQTIYKLTVVGSGVPCYAYSIDASAEIIKNESQIVCVGCAEKP